MTATPLCNSILCFFPLSDMKQAPLVSLLPRHAQFVSAELLPVWALLLAELSFDIFSTESASAQHVAELLHPPHKKFSHLGSHILKPRCLSKWKREFGLNSTLHLLIYNTSHYISIYFIPLLHYLLYCYYKDILRCHKRYCCIFSWDTALPGGQGHIPQQHDI